MNHFLKRLIALVAVISITGMIFAGCNKKADDSTVTTKDGNSAQTTAGQTTAAQTTTPEVYKPKADKLTIQTTNRVVPDENYIKSWMEENIGIELNFIIASGNELNTKVNLLIASKEIPDIMTLPSNSSTALYFQFVEQGLLADLDPLLKYAPNVLKARTEEQIEALRYKDGKLYALNSNVQTSYDMLLLRQDWLAKLNLKVPATLDELTEVMRAFVNEDPNGTGQADTTGYQGWGGLQSFNAIWAAFGSNPNHWVLKDGKVVHGAMQPEVKEAVKYLRMLFEEGLMDKEYLTVDRAKVNEKVSTGKTGMVHDQLWYVSPDYSIYHQSPGASWVGIAPPKGPSGKSGYITGGNPIVRQFTVISKDSKDPVMAMKWLDFIADYDNYKKIRMGTEGEHYNIVNGKTVVVEKYLQDNSLLIQQGITATYAMPFLAVDALREMFSLECHDVYLPLRRANEKHLYSPMYFPVPKIAENLLGDGWSDAYFRVINKLIMEGGDIENEFNAVVELIYDRYSMSQQEQYANEYYNEMN